MESPQILCAAAQVVVSGLGKEKALIIIILQTFYDFFPFFIAFLITPIKSTSGEILTHSPPILVVTINHEYVRNKFSNIKLIT